MPTMSGLSSISLLIDKLTPELQKPSIILICPAIHHVVLRFFRHIQESVFIPVMRFFHPVSVQKEHSTPFITKFDTEIGVKLVHSLATRENISRKQFRVTGFLIVYADLPGHRFVTVNHRPRSLRHGDSGHPRTGNVSQTVQRSQSPEIRHILGHHLHVLPG